MHWFRLIKRKEKMTTSINDCACTAATAALRLVLLVLALIGC
jgi:hypothetical protein